MNTITLKGPGKNALSLSLMHDLIEQVRALAPGGEPLLVVGDGDAFSAGLDLKEVHALDLEGMRGFHRALEDLVEALWRYPGPTAAAVNGHAIAGGMILALVCDHRVVTTEPRARLGLNEVALGLRFPPRVLAMVRDRLHREHEWEVLLGAGLHGPEDAARLGLVDGVSDDPVAAATAWLERFSRHPEGAYAGAKLMMRPVVELTAQQQAHFEQDVLPLWVSTEIKDRIASFFER